MKTLEELKELVRNHDEDGCLSDDDRFEISLYDEEEEDFYMEFDDLHIRENEDHDDSSENEELVLRNIYHEPFFVIEEVLGVKDGKVEVKLSLDESIYDDEDEVLDTSKPYLLSIKKVKIKRTYTNLIDGSITEEER